MDFYKALPIVLQNLAGDEKYDKETAKSLAALGVRPPSRETLLSLEIPSGDSKPAPTPPSNLSDIL